MKLCKAKEGCTDKASSLGFCYKHYSRWKRHGDTGFTKTVPNGSAVPHIDRSGYRVFPKHMSENHPNCRKDGRIYEHVLVMSKMLGRALRDNENVHHKNGIRDDNRPENLELWVTKQPFGQRPEDLVSYALEILQNYGPQYLREDIL